MKGLEHSLEAEFCLSVHLSVCLSHCAGFHPSVHKSGIVFRQLQWLTGCLMEGRNYTCYLYTTKVVPATLWQPFQVSKRRITELTRNDIARSMRHTVSIILACQYQPMVSGGHAHKAVNKATPTGRCSSCLYILLLYVWHIRQRQPSWSHNPLWPDVFTVISKFWTNFLTVKFPNNHA